MKRAFQLSLTAAIVSSYIYSFSFTFLPTSINTKIILAVVGAVLYILDCVKKHHVSFSKGFFISTLLACAFSLVCLISITDNHTHDTTYVTYFASFFTWMGGAYAVCRMIKRTHGYITLELLTYYLASVAAFQCIIAQVIDLYPPVQLIVDSFIQQGQSYLHRTHRLYGIGASLDTAGIRFAVTLVLTGHLIAFRTKDDDDFRKTTVLLSAFVIITILGNMISRTTVVGAGLGLIPIFISRMLITSAVISKEKLSFWGVLLALLSVTIVICAILYNTNSSFHQNMRFAFEGFFNYAETGVWRTGSTDKLNAKMWIWPQNIHDWIIGTGRFGGFFYSTDIGYCRFVLYSGVLGLGAFSAFFIYQALLLGIRFRNCTILALLLLATTFIIWMKVSTDIFFIYALTLSLHALNEDGTDIVQIEETN